jgi:hypothetical protein
VQRESVWVLFKHLNTGEMMITKILTLTAALGILGLFACSSSDNGSLTLSNVPDTLSVGATSTAILAVLKARNAEGQLETISPYTNFDLVSDDTLIVRVFSGHTIRGEAAGTTTVSATDLGGSGLISPKYTVIVKAQ